MPRLARYSSKLFTILGSRGVATPTFTITPSTNTVSEGSTVTFTVTLSGGAPDGTYYVRVNSLTGSVVPDDFSTALPPNLTLQVAVSGGSGSLALAIQSDGDTEASDSFNVSLISSWGNTTVLANSSTVTISDATPPNGFNLGNQYNGVMQSGENIFPDFGNNTWPVMQMRYFDGASANYGLWLNQHATYQSTVPYTANAIQGNGNGGGVLLVVDNTNNRMARFNIPYKDFRSWNRPDGWDFTSENYQRWNSTSYHANPLPVVSNPHNLWVKEGGRQYIITDRTPTPHNMRLWHGEFGLEGPGGVNDTYRINVGGGLSFTDWASYFSFNGFMSTVGAFTLSNNGTYMFLATSTDLVRFTLSPAGYTSNSSITWGADYYWPYRQMLQSGNPISPVASTIRGMTWNQATVSGQAAGKRFFYSETSSNRLYCAQAETPWNLGRVTTTFFRGISSGVQFFSLTQGLNSIFVDSTAASLYGTTSTLTTYTAPGTADAATRPSIERWTLPAGFEISASHTLTTRYFLRNYWVHRAQTMTGFIMNDARTKMVAASDTTFDGLYSYTLSSAGDISTALWDGNNTFPRINVNTTYGGSYSVGTNMSVWFKSDGLRCYALGRTQIIQFDLLEAWEIGSAEYTGRFTVSTQDGTMNDIYIRDTGTQFWLCGATNDRVFQYSMSTAWDINTASYTGTSFLNSGQETNATGLFFKSDGTVMYLLGTINRIVRQYTLGTAWSLGGTVTYNTGASTRSVAGQTTAPAGMFIRDNGLQMVICAGTGVIYFYTLGTAWDFAGTFTYNGSVTLTSTMETVARGIFFRPAGDRFWTFGGSGFINQHDISAWSTSGYSTRSLTVGNGYFDLLNSYAPLGTSTQGGIYTDDGLNFLIGYSNDLAGFTCSAAWNLSTMSYYWNHARSTTFPTTYVSGQFRDIRRPTGNSSVLFTMRVGYLEKWTTTALLPVPGIAGWLSQVDITTGVRDDHARLTNYNATELTGVADIKLYDNDRKLLILNRTSSAILWRFDLTAPSTLPGATVTNTGGTVTADGRGPNTLRAFAFNREGNVCYLGDTSISITRLYRHNLSTPWQLNSTTTTTAIQGGVDTFVNKGYYEFSAQGFTGRKIRVRPDGTSFYICNTDTIYQYNMSTPYELSSASFFGSYTVTPQTNMGATTLRDFWIDKDTGTTLVCLSASRALIGGFTLGTAWNITTTSRPGTTNTIILTGTGMASGNTTWFWWVQGARAGYTVVVYNNISLRLHKYELTVPWDTTTASNTGDSAATAGSGGSYSGSSRSTPINGIAFQDYNDIFGPYIGIGFDLQASIDSNYYAPNGASGLLGVDVPMKLSRCNYYGGIYGAVAPWDQEQRYITAHKLLTLNSGSSDAGGVDVVQSGTRIYCMEGSAQRVWSYRTYNPGGAWNNVAP